MLKNKLAVILCIMLLSCNNNKEEVIDHRLHGAWEFVLGEDDKEVIIYNHKGPVSFYYFSDSLLHFFSRLYEDDSLEYEAFNCWTENYKIYTTFDDTVRSSIFYDFRHDDTIVLSKEINFNSNMVLVRRDYNLNQLKQLINETFTKKN